MKNNMKTYRAFTVAELMIGILVMAISSAAMLLSASSAKQTAQHEAERLAAYIYRTMNKADRIHQGFDMDMDFEEKNGAKEYYVTIKWWGGMNNYDKSFRASKGCAYTDNFIGIHGIAYNETNKRFNSGGTITVTDSQGEKYYVIIAGITEGRIRTSPTNSTSAEETPSE